MFGLEQSVLCEYGSSSDIMLIGIFSSLFFAQTLLFDRLCWIHPMLIRFLFTTSYFDLLWNLLIQVQADHVPFDPNHDV